MSKPGRIPLPIEIREAIEDAESFCRVAAAGGPRAHCGAEVPGDIAGIAPRCRLLSGHSLKIMHRDEHGFRWWGA